VKKGAQLFLKERWMKYVIASVLIHGATLSIPLPIIAPRSVEPIEIFMLEGAGSSSPSGGSQKRDRPRGKLRLGRQGAMVREDVRIRPQEPIGPTEHKAEPLQAVTENITGNELVARNEPVGLAEIGAGVAIEGGREATGSASGSSGTSVGGGSAQGDGKGGGDAGSADGGSGAGVGSGSGQGDGTGSGDMEFGSRGGPRFLYREVPEYPLLARKRKKEGSVVLMLVIDTAGRLTKADVVEASDKVFIEVSLEALKKSTFLPARRNGQPVTSRALLPIRFSLIE